MLERLPGYSLNIPIQQFPVAPAPPVVPTAAILAHLGDSVAEAIQNNSPTAKALRAVQLAKAQSELRNIPLTESMSRDVYAHPEKYITETSIGPNGTSISAKPISPEFTAAGGGLPSTVYPGVSPVGPANENTPLPALEIPPPATPDATTAPEKPPGQELAAIPVPGAVAPASSDEAVAPKIDVAPPASEVPPKALPGYRILGKIAPNEWEQVNAEGKHITVKGALKPVLHTDPASGKLYDVTDPTNPKEVEFPGQMSSGKVGDEAISDLNDQDKTTIRKMANYEWPIPPGGIRNPHQLDLLQKATLYDPSFSPSDYTLRQSTKKDYESGKSFQNIRSLNTLAGHLGNLEQSAAALNNTGTPFVNTVENAFATHVQGKSAVPTFEADKNAVISELGQLLRGGAVTDAEQKHFEAAISSSSSPDQLKSTIHEFASLAKSRLDALQQGYEGVMRKPADIQIVSPKAKDVFTKLGVMTPEEVSATPGGKAGFGAPSTATPTVTPVAPKPTTNPTQLYQMAVDTLRQNPNDPKAKAVIDRLRQLGQLPTPQPTGQPTTTAIEG